MRRFRAAQAFSLGVGFVVVGTFAGCSGTTKSDGVIPADGAGEGGTVGGGAGKTESGGRAGAVGKGGTGGSGRGGGSFGGAAAKGGESFGGAAATGGRSFGGAAATGGTGGQACRSGVPCNCDALSGVTQCTGSESSCVCPPAQNCEVAEDPHCFQPCGGDPFGAWVLEASCYAKNKTTNASNCQAVTQATPGKNDLRMRILDGGSFELFGREDWSVSSRISLGCGFLSSTESCTTAFYASRALLFSDTPPVSCKANACGACDCLSNSQTFSLDSISSWNRDGMNLILGNANVPYCVTGDELWIGGVGIDGSPKVSYKFKKQSCVGKPLSCGSRTSDQCEVGNDCTKGRCEIAAGGTSPHCNTGTTEPQCGVLQGCVWNPNSCTGQASTACDFGSCGTQPGCNWGPPQEKCGGESDCFERDLSDCNDLGCSVVSCQPNGFDNVDCSTLDSIDCARAVGCVSGPGGTCTGQALCSKQTDSQACFNLGCSDGAACFGTPTACPDLSLTDCDRMPGCRREW